MEEECIKIGKITRWKHNQDLKIKSHYKTRDSSD
jgi:hypothetical protein